MKKRNRLDKDRESDKTLFKENVREYLSDLKISYGVLKR